MEVILLKDVDNLGDANAVVKVRDGYGRNYLIPQGLAVVANDGNRRMLQELRITPGRLPASNDPN
jgi:large subunit ribosomal protein L9